MAFPLTCDLDQTHGEANFLVTNLDSQDAKAFCVACFARTALAIATAVLPKEELLTAIEPPPPRGGADGQEAPRARGGRKSAAKGKRLAQPKPGLSPIPETPASAADR